jgi:hypothetical protein
MKAILEFNLPEDELDLSNAINGNKFKLILWDMDQHLRNIVKYGENEEAVEVAEELRNKLREYFSEYNVSIE